MNEIFFVAVTSGDGEQTDFPPVFVDTAASLVTALLDKPMTAASLLELAEPGQAVRTERPSDGALIEVYRLTEGEAENVTYTV